MLEEIHEWYEKNLKDAKTVSVTAAHFKENLTHIDADPQLTFELYAEMPDGKETSLVRPRVSFHSQWLDIRDNKTPSRLFRCHCRLVYGLERSTALSQDDDHTANLQFSCEADFTIPSERDIRSRC
jgi:hypothetical protein